MSAMRYDRLFGWRCARWFFILTFVTLLGLPFTVDYLRSRQSIWALLSIILVMALSVPLVAFVIYRGLLSRYRCAECGALLPYPNKERGKRFELRYYCAHCDIIWETGVKESND
jgi:hypothetical protein